MRWVFREISPNEVETEVTQRDHFRNDEVDLSDTVVREAVQNSLDAQQNGQQVHVRFVLIKRLSQSFMKHIFSGHIEHAKAANVIDSDFETSNAFALVIEDFGTCGLTGKVDRKDNDNFSDFWRRHGKSHKGGKAGGRWGLGKLVYSYASNVGAFFGVTFREGDHDSYLMGQTVLNTHAVNGAQYAPHGFFADELATGDEKGLQVPVQSHQLNAMFEQHFELHRRNRNGLSLVIPYPREEIKLRKMTAVAVENYFFPILTEQLVLTVGPTTINNETLREVAKEFVVGDMDLAEALFGFVEAAHRTTEVELHELDAVWFKDWKLNADDFKPEELEALKARFAAGELVALRLPMIIKKKDGTTTKSFFDLYIKQAPALKRGRDLYVRGGITVPGEAKFKHRKALGALVARDDAISAFLGDAENAAHTRWNGKAEKLRDYRNAPATLRAIRNSLVWLHDVLMHAAEEEAEDALLDFFWTPKKTGGMPKSRRKSSPKPVVPVIPKPRPIRVVTTRDGFSLKPGPAAQTFPMPAKCIVMMAYDTFSGNPFKNYSEFDFNAQSGLAVVTRGAENTGGSGNVLEFSIKQPDFEIDVSGFDSERDVITRVTMTEA